MNLPGIILLLLAAFFSFPTLAQDWRRVNQSSVNLDPLHEWLKGDRREERPLAHWKELTLQEINGALHTYDKCVVLFEDGKMIEIYIDNLEPAIRLPFIKARQLQTEVEKIEAQIINDEELLAKLPQRRQSNEQRVSLRAAIKRQRQAVQRLQRELQTWSARQEIAAKTGFLAMFRGMNVAGLPLWDCGVKIDPKKGPQKNPKPSGS